MGYILPQTYRQVWEQGNIQPPTTFIETGTFKGGVPLRILEQNVVNKQLPLLDETFDEYYTIEIDPKICSIASYRYKVIEELGLDVTPDIIHTEKEDLDWDGSLSYFNNRLALIEGDSATVLEDILSYMGECIAFWLDAHSGAQKYARGQDDVALFRELEVIKKHKVKNHIIAIDDVHLFGRKQYDRKGNLVADYTNVTWKRVEEKIKEINPAYQIGRYAPFQMDMLIAFVEHKTIKKYYIPQN